MMRVWLAVLAGCLGLCVSASTAGVAGVDLKPTAEKPTEVVLSADGAQLTFYRHIWQAMKVKTPGGKELPITDLFFYGSRQYDTDDVLIITSRAKDDVFEVERIGSFEHYAWHTAYRNCIQRDKFID